MRLTSESESADLEISHPNPNPNPKIFKNHIRRITSWELTMLGIYFIIYLAFSTCLYVFDRATEWLPLIPTFNTLYIIYNILNKIVNTAL